MKAEFHLIEQPKDACAFVPDYINITEEDYKKYVSVIPNGVKLYDGKQAPNYVIVIGDGEMFLKCARLFQKQSTPPILGFANGENVVNYNFGLKEIKEVFPVYLEEVKSKKVTSQEIMKLQVKNCETSYIIGESVN